MIDRLLRIGPAAGLLLAGLVLAAVAPATVAGGGGCHRQGISDETATTVSMVDNCFVATVVRVEPGATVTWTNDDAYPHAVTGAASSFGTYDEVAAGASVRHTFSAPGIYPYSCYIHAGMVGAVVVGDGGAGGGTSSGAVAGGGASNANGPAAEAGTAASAAEAGTAASAAEAGTAASAAEAGTDPVALAGPAIAALGVLAVILGIAARAYGRLAVPRRRTSAR